MPSKVWSLKDSKILKRYMYVNVNVEVSLGLFIRQFPLFSTSRIFTPTAHSKEISNTPVYR